MGFTNHSSGNIDGGQAELFEAGGQRNTEIPHGKRGKCDDHSTAAAIV